MEYLNIALSLATLALLLYAVRALRTIGGKISTLQSQQSKGVKEIERQISSQRQYLKRVAQLQALPHLDAKSRDWKFIVSMTSHAPRFHALSEVIESLKSQILQPQSILLNISHSEVADLPDKIKALAKDGFITIVSTEDLGPAKKLVPTLQSHKHLPVIVIDDDLSFDSELFLHLMAQHYLYPTAIIASRVHQVTTNTKGEINRFEEWNKQFISNDGPSKDLMPTSGAGTLYPPDSLHLDASNGDLYRRISNYTDDLWWYFQGRRKGTLVRRVSGFSDLNFIDATQEAGLWKNGNQERNEANLLNLVQEYGNPLTL